MGKRIGFITFQKSLVTAGIAVQSDSGWTARLVEASTEEGNSTDLYAKLASQHQAKELVVLLPASHAFWSTVELNVASQSELRSSIQLQYDRFQSEHPQHEIRHVLSSTEKRLQMVAVDKQPLRDIREQAQRHGLELTSICVSPLPLSGLLNKQAEKGLTCLICPDGTNTTIALLEDGVREASTQVPYFLRNAFDAQESANWEPLFSAVTRLSVSVGRPIKRVLLVPPAGSHAKAMADFSDMLALRFNAPVTSMSPEQLGWCGPIPDEFASLVGLLTFKSPQDVPCNFAVQPPSFTTKPNLWRWVAAANVLVGLAGIWGLGEWWDAQQAARRRELEQHIAELDTKLEQVEDSNKLHEFLIERWDQPDWLPPLQQIAEAGPDEGIRIRNLAIDSTPQGKRTVRVEGRSTSAAAIVSWNQLLLERRDAFNVVPHAVESLADDNQFPHRFVMEVEAHNNANSEDEG